MTVKPLEAWRLLGEDRLDRLRKTARGPRRDAGSIPAFSTSKNGAKTGSKPFPGTQYRPFPETPTLSPTFRPRRVVLMNEDEFFDDENCDMDRVGHEESELPPYEFSWALLAADWLDNVGDMFEHVAEFPKSLVRRIQAHHVHVEQQKLFAAETAREIETMTGDRNA